MIKTRHIPQRFIALILAILMVGMGALLPHSAYALSDVSDVSSETEVSLSSDLDPLILVSRNYEEGATVEEGSNLTLEAVFSGGVGTISYTWAVSLDGGKTYSPLPATANTYEIVNAKLHPTNGNYLYRLYAADSSIQRLEVLYTVKVVPKSSTPDPTPVVNNSSGKGIGVKTSDMLSSSVILIAGILLSALVILLIARKMRNTAKGQS